MSNQNWGKLDDPDVVRSRALCEAEAVGPPPKDRFQKDRWAAASMHSIIMNHLEAVYKNATHIAENDLATYIGVAHECMFYLAQHHKNQEDVYFPPFENHYKMGSNREQHGEFLPSVEQTIAYLDSVKPGKGPGSQVFSALKFRALMDSWLPQACSHMALELDTLDASIVRKHMTIPELDKAEKAVMAHNQATLDMLKVLPWMIYNRPVGCQFPGLPWLVTVLVIPILALWNWRDWKYHWKARRWESTVSSPLN